MPIDQQRIFSSFRLDLANQQLWRGKKQFALRRKTFEVLRYLVDRPGQLVTKAALLDAVWTDVAVSDSMPSICVAELRKVLHDDARQPGIIETVHGRGYRFIAPITPPENAATLSDSPPPAARPSLVVGRGPELEQVRGWFARVIAGTRNVVFVSGEPGIGKTTFVRAFLDSITGDDAVRIARGQCIEQYGEGEPYMPMLEALTQLGRGPEGPHLIALLQRLAPAWLAQLPALLTAEERTRFQGEIHGLTHQRMLREMMRALEALAAKAPLVLLLEDLHWSDPSTLELIAAIAQQTESTRLLIIGTYRPAEMLTPGHPLRRMKGELDLHHRCSELRLRFLNQRDIGDYLAGRFGEGREANRFSEIAAILYARTEGNPLFVVDLVDFLVAQGILDASGGASTNGAASSFDARQIDLPQSIIEMVERHLEALGVEEQRLLEAASASGVEFSAAAVAAALERPVSEVEACCTRLSRREQFIQLHGVSAWPDGTIASNVRFLHALYRKVLYDRVPPGHRVQLHRRIAEREEAAYGAGAGAIAAELADHYECANDKSKAARYLQLAGERAVVRGAMAEGARHYVRALELLNELPEGAERDRQELELQLAVGPALIAVKGFAAPEVARASTRLRELFQRLGDSQELLPALFGLWVMHMASGELSRAVELAEGLFRQAQNNRPRLIYARSALGNNKYYMGEFLSAREHLETSIATYELELQRPLALPHLGFDAGVYCLSGVALTLWQLGFPDQALKRSNEAQALAQRLSHPYSLIFAESMSGVVHHYRREVNFVQESAERALAVSTEHEILGLSDVATSLQGWAMTEQGRKEAATDHLPQDMAAYREAPGELVRPYFQCLLAEACGAAGRLDEGLSALAEALAAADQYENRVQEAEIYRLRGELLLKRQAERGGAEQTSLRGALEMVDSNAAEARSCFERTIAIAREQHAKSWELRATTSLARLLDQQGCREEGRTLLAHIYNWFTEGFDTADLKDAKALLDRLTSEF